MRRAKIVCTLGPATATKLGVRQLIDAGMDVARLNLSHGSHEEHERVLKLVRQASEESGRNIAVFADLQGPKIRLETFAEGSAMLTTGQEWTITVRDVPGDDHIAGTTYKGLPGDCSPGDPILIDDGKIRLRVREVTDEDVLCVVEVGGPVSNNKGINLPGVAVSVPAMSPKDEDDLRWALRAGVDYIALSFVRSGEDVQGVHKIMDEEGLRLPVIAKIEKPQAIENIKEIIDAFDAFMVARGDLGVECPLEDVPFLQKRVIDRARRNAKPVIVATQMLESMIQNPAPTRAEASDVANAVLDGADAVMLSGETSVGKYPIVAVHTMARIIASTEDHELHHTAAITWNPKTRGGVIAKAAAEVAQRVNARYLVAFTQSGDSAHRLSRLRTETPIIAFSPDRTTLHQLALSWGVEAYYSEPVEHTDEMVRQVDEELLASGLAMEGELVVIIAGSPPGIPGSTNALRIHRMGDAINEAAPAYRRG